jgi:hypothetical protein
MLRRLRVQARRALAEAGREDPGDDWTDPAPVTGWWCAECGNVDMPQPCLGVCVWRPVEWVNLALYDRRSREAETRLRAARALTRFLARAAAITPRTGAWERNLEALRDQAVAVLAVTGSLATTGR